ncbi:MAG: AAA family ATPase, partial [Nanoarchaeota archaeon]
MTDKETLGTEQEKVRTLYNLIGERGLYVNSNFDVFSQAPELVDLAGGTGYKIPLVNKGSNAYASPLLFATLTSLLNHGTMLVTGAPGIGKTTGAEFAGHFFTGTPLEEILASEIKGNPQKTEEKMIARYHTGKLITTGEELVLPRKFLKCPVKIIDEVNRMPADLTSIIMDLADTGKAIYGDELLKAAPGPFIATANYADEGTFQLTPPFLDRFDVAVMVTSPPAWDLAKIRSRGDEKLNGGLNEALQIPDGLKLNFDKIRKEIKDMPQDVEYGVPQMSTFADFVYSSLRFSEAASGNIARATKGNAWQVNQDNSPVGHFQDSPFNYTLNELSVRSAKAMPRYAKAFAWLNGDDKVTPAHVKTILPFLLWHKVQPTAKALSENPLHANDR